MKVPLPRNPVPMFPLPGVFLFPAQILPLHVFEERYLQLVSDCLDGPGRIVVPTVIGEGNPAPVLPVAGLGEIVRHERLENGRYHIWLLGLQRVRIEEAPSDRLYRLASCHPFEEVQADVDEARHLKSLLRAATRSRLPEKLPIPDRAPTGVLTDLLLQIVQAPQSVMEDIFTEQSVAERARKVLAAHRRYPRAPEIGGEEAE